MSDKFKILNDNGNFFINGDGVLRQEFDNNNVQIFREKNGQPPAHVDPRGVQCSGEGEEIIVVSKCGPHPNWGQVQIPVPNGEDCVIVVTTYSCDPWDGVLKWSIKSQNSESCYPQKIWNATSNMCVPLMIASIDILP